MCPPNRSARRAAPAVLCLLFAARWSWAAAVPSGFTITDLGDLGGSSAVPYGINNAGQVVGASVTGNGAVHAFRWQAGGPMTDLLPLEGSTSIAYGINPSGQVVGWAQIPGSATRNAFRTAPNQPINPNTDLLAILSGADTVARGINATGQTVGDCGLFPTPFSFAFLFDGGLSKNLGTLGGIGGLASSINDAGQIAGVSATAAAGSHAFLYTGGGLQDLGTLGGWGSWANAVNATGQVAGASWLAGDQAYHACLFGTGTRTDLGTLGGNYSVAHGINTAGQVVGEASLAGDATHHAFLYSNGTKIDLNGMLPAGSGWVLETAYAINDSGQIAGAGLHDGRQRAFLATPVPPTPVNEFGQTYCDTITVPGQTYSYKYLTQDGDCLFVRAARSPGAELWPQIIVFDPAGNKAASNYGASSVTKYNIQLSQAGTTTVVVGDGLDGTRLGSFCVFAQRINATVNAVALVPGQTVQGKIEHPGQMDTYTVAVNAGDGLVLRMARISGDLWPQIFLFGPPCQLIDSQYGSSSVTISTGKLPQSGTYVVLVGDGLDGTRTGEYGLSLSKV